jgi:hypothetical protein
MHAVGESYRRAVLLAWALTGNDINRMPEDDEWEALIEFCKTHSEEIDTSGRKCLQAMCDKANEAILRGGK